MRSHHDDVSEVLQDIRSEILPGSSLDRLLAWWIDDGPKPELDAVELHELTDALPPKPGEALRSYIASKYH